MRAPAWLVLMLGLSACSVWIGAAEVPEVTVTPVDTSTPVDSGDTGETPVCAELLSIEGPPQGEDVWLLQRFYLRFDQAVPPNELSLEVGPVDGATPAVSVPRLPGIFEGHEAHVVQSPPDGWSTDGEQRLVVSWGEGCEATLDFQVVGAPPVSALGLDASQAYVGFVADGRLFPSTLPFRVDDIETNPMFRAFESWSGQEEPTQAVVVMAQGLSQHTCSNQFLRFPGPLIEGEHISYNLKDQPLVIDGHLTRVRTGSFTVRFREDGLYIDRAEFSIPVGSLGELDLCESTVCRPCSSGDGQCATFWVEGFVPVPVEASLGPSEVQCDDDPLGECDGFCEEGS